MGKNKLKRFSDNAQFDHVIEHTEFQNQPTPKGKWQSEIFGNENPIVLELACGAGDYALGLAQKYPEKNFIGIDIKGSRIWKGAKIAKRKSIENVRFLRLLIDHLDDYFAPGEVSEIWITFPDPHLKVRNRRKRLTSPKFLEIYKKIASDSCTINLKTDSPSLFKYTLEIIEQEKLLIKERVDDVYLEKADDPDLSIKTFYEKMHLKNGRTIQFVSFSAH